MRLSILICTIPERKQKLDVLLAKLNEQIAFNKFQFAVQVLIDDRPRSVPTGEKRNNLIHMCRGDYFCFIDDDDWVDPSYVLEIFNAIQAGPDVVTFKGWMTTNGGARVDWVIKLGEKYEARTDPDGITRYYRFPNHLTVMKKELVQGFLFQPIWQGEDYEWAKRIHDMKALNSEVHIDKQLYWYDFRTDK